LTASRCAGGYVLGGYFLVVTASSLARTEVAAMIRGPLKAVPDFLRLGIFQRAHNRATRSISRIGRSNCFPHNLVITFFVILACFFFLHK
jgi:hypothetical protein